MDFADEAIQKIIPDYTREAGVRNLERNIGDFRRFLGPARTESERWS
ncbi:MAG: hypothetical protein WAL98_17730 [Desulfatiglandaceae bacterium]|jgi:ATP-dependent Lon protease